MSERSKARTEITRISRRRSLRRGNSENNEGAMLRSREAISRTERDEREQPVV